MGVRSWRRGKVNSGCVVRGRGKVNCEWRVVN